MIVVRFVTLAVAVAVAQVPAPAPQNPSPMTDTTRPHPRVVEYQPRGRRLPVGAGTLFIRDGLKPAARIPLIVHFHGAPWLIEHHISKLKRDAVLVTFQLGSGSGVYARAFAEPAPFEALLADTAARASEVLGRPVTLDPLVLTSFSAGYGAIRAILRQPDHYSRVAGVMLADSMHASYAAPDAGAPRAEDLAVLTTDIDAFNRFAADAVAGRKRFVVLHSEVFPGTYASTTETADAMLRAVGLRRRPRLHEGPIGMQQLSETTGGKLAVVGYAGNSAPDHMDHLYALGEQLARWNVLKD